MAITFCVTLVGWVFFRAASVRDALQYLSMVVSPTLFTKPQVFPVHVLLSIVFFMLVEWVQRGREHALEFRGRRAPMVLRWGLYYALALAILWFGGSQQEFIYFQF